MLSSQEIIDLKNYERQKKLFKNKMTKYYKIIDLSNQKSFLAKIWIDKIDDCIRDKIRDLCREIYINSKINHPSFLKYIGFSLKNLKRNPNPVIVFEYPNHNLNAILNSKKIRVYKLL